MESIGTKCVQPRRMISFEAEYHLNSEVYRKSSDDHEPIRAEPLRVTRAPGQGGAPGTLPASAEHRVRVARSGERMRNDRVSSYPVGPKFDWARTREFGKTFYREAVPNRQGVLSAGCKAIDRIQARPPSRPPVHHHPYTGLIDPAYAAMSRSASDCSGLGFVRS